ncbi:MAG: DNA polymerase III subunit gamma/tau [Arsenophonus sp.]
MSYQVLARKWRPQIFTDIIGQQDVLTAIINSLAKKRLHHAYLFSGTRGVGKTTIARLFAKGLNCEMGIRQNFCDKCANCLEITQGEFVDLIEIDAASRTKVEDIRELLDNVQYSPVRGRFKVYLIDEVHMLSRHSFNALLKTLEEPPEHVKFLLATTDPQKLPITVLSRCIQFHLRSLDIKQISFKLKHILMAEKIDSDEHARQLISIAAKGSLRDALSLTEQAIAIGNGKVLSDSVSKMLGILDNEQPLSIIEAIVYGDAKKMMCLLEDIALRDNDWENVLIEMLSLVHRIAMIQLLPLKIQDIISPIEDRLNLLANLITSKDLQFYYQTLLVGRKELPYAPDRRMGIEMTLLRALTLNPKNVDDIKISLKSSHNFNKIKTKDENINNHIDIFTDLKDKKLINTPTSKLLRAKELLNINQEKYPLKNSETSSLKTKTSKSIIKLERLPIVSKKYHSFSLDKSKEIYDIKQNENYSSYEHYKSHTFNKELEQVTTICNIQQSFECEKTNKLSNKIMIEVKNIDNWANEISNLKISNLIEQLALNSYKESLSETEICLHLRSTKRHLNTRQAHKALTKAMSELYGKLIKLTIIEDDNPDKKTPLELRQIIYEEKIDQARKAIADDKKIKILLKLFDAQLDEESIRPV